MGPPVHKIIYCTMFYAMFPIKFITRRRAETRNCKTRVETCGFDSCRTAYPLPILPSPPPRVRSFTVSI